MLSWVWNLVTDCVFSFLQHWTFSFSPCASYSPIITASQGDPHPSSLQTGPASPAFGKRQRQGAGLVEPGVLSLFLTLKLSPAPCLHIYSHNICFLWPLFAQVLTSDEDNLLPTRAFKEQGQHLPVPPPLSHPFSACLSFLS